MRALVAVGLLILTSACATAPDRSYCEPESDLAEPTAQWIGAATPASAEALLGLQYAIHREDWRLLHWFTAGDGRIAACVRHRGPTLFGEEYVIFSSADAGTATVQPGHNNLKMVIAH